MQAARRFAQLTTPFGLKWARRAVPKFSPEESEKLIGRISNPRRKNFKSVSEDFEIDEKWLTQILARPVEKTYKMSYRKLAKSQAEEFQKLIGRIPKRARKNQKSCPDGFKNSARWIPKSRKAWPVYVRLCRRFAYPSRLLLSSLDAFFQGTKPGHLAECLAHQLDPVTIFIKNWKSLR